MTVSRTDQACCASHLGRVNGDLEALPDEKLRFKRTNLEVFILLHPSGRTDNSLALACPLALLPPFPRIKGSTFNIETLNPT